jgi:hypothetical protein
MAVLAFAAGPRAALPQPTDNPMLALWCWTYASSVLAHAVFLGLPWSALWGGVLMGAVVLPLAVRLREDSALRSRLDSAVRSRRG